MLKNDKCLYVTTTQNLSLSRQCKYDKT